MIEHFARFELVDTELMREVAISVDGVGNPPPRFDANKVAFRWVWTPNAHVRGIWHGHFHTMAGFFSERMEKMVSPLSS